MHRMPNWTRRSIREESYNIKIWNGKLIFRHINIKINESVTSKLHQVTKTHNNYFWSNHKDKTLHTVEIDEQEGGEKSGTLKNEFNSNLLNLILFFPLDFYFVAKTCKRFQLKCKTPNSTQNIIIQKFMIFMIWSFTKTF